MEELRASVGRTRLREIVDEYKRQPCAICGKTFPPCAMDFHHKDEMDKKDNVARLISKAYGINTILKEISKCVVICACCHRILHYASEEN